MNLTISEPAMQAGRNKPFIFEVERVHLSLFGYFLLLFSIPGALSALCEWTQKAS